jgi:multidrug efflux pump subunit AcrA (membrane-fusion protein)
VKIGRITDGLRIVQEGLTPGENVVVNGMQRIHPGSVVQAEVIAMDARAQQARVAANK